MLVIAIDHAIQPEGADICYRCIMLELIQNLEAHFWWLLAVSLLSFVGTLIAVPMLLVRIPRDYFAHEKRRRPTRNSQSILTRAVLVIAKNTLGAILIVVGALLLFTPGQGILTMLVGLILMNYPGKYRLERWLVTRPAVFRTINWLRQRARRKPLVL